MSDKRYIITLTEKQFDLVGEAVEMMMRTGRGQMYDLAEWLTLAGNDYPRGSDLFCLYVTERNLIQSVLDGIMQSSETCDKFEYSMHLVGRRAKCALTDYMEQLKERVKDG